MSISSALLAFLLMTSAPEATTCSSDVINAAAPRDGETYIRRAEAEWASSVAKGEEAAFLRRFTADDFAAILEGKLLSRTALIAEAERRRPGAASDKLETLRVHVFGSTAVAEGSEIWSEGGHRTRIVWADIWTGCGEKWRLVTSTSRGSKVVEMTTPHFTKAPR